MYLNDEPLLARKMATQKQSEALHDLCLRACPAIAEKFRSFEKYCGTVDVSAVPAEQNSVQISVRFNYKWGYDNKLVFRATVRRHGDDLVLVDRRGGAPIAVPEPGCIALAFLDAVATPAERAFEAIVLEEPWRLRQIFLSRQA